jgi:hypothetical protein
LKPAFAAAPAERHPYACALYARALAGLGRTLEVPQWNAFVTARPIPGGAGEDAAGPYPLTVLAADADLAAGREMLAQAGLVSLVMVPDPLSGPGADAYRAAFEVCRPFKTHQLVEPRPGYEPSRHHRDRIRRGLRRCRIEAVRLQDRIGQWRGLYADLIDRRSIRGPAAFAPGYFDALAEEPRLTTFAAFVGDILTAATLWFEHDGVAYNHLTAASALGRQNGAAFALYATAISHYGAASVINLGGGAGLGDDPNDGLAAFKRGFANASVEALLCGTVLDPPAYRRLCGSAAPTTFFPAYRA